MPVPCYVVAGMIGFTDNYRDHSNRDGYQFEFLCERCGNGYTSSFKHSVTGFGGKLLRMGGDLVGGEWGQRASALGWDSQWMRDGVRGGAWDKALQSAVEEMKPYFAQCHRCGEWVCGQICWNTERGVCTTCAPKLDQEVAGLQASAQRDQLRDKIGQQDWTNGVQYGHEVTARCPSCQNDAGGGKYCQHCGTPLAAAPEASKFCGQCGTKLGPSAMFCTGCGSQTT
jgi:hypothetical protein